MNKWVCPPGMGHAALALDAKTVKRLNELPDDIEILRALPLPPHWSQAASETERQWQYTPPWGTAQPIYLHIQHRFLSRMATGQVLEIMGLDELLDRYRTMASRIA
jgi:hypothetical protein